jgi:uncharacterized OB-fold protein
VHPPQPVCPWCRDGPPEIRAVSGFGTLVGFTVNHRFGLPGLPPPYVVGQVALEEDPAVRLTTRVVGCDPAELVLGMRMEVELEPASELRADPALLELAYLGRR